MIPDVIVRKHQGAWRVELNDEAMPRLRINKHYAGLIRRADNSNDNTYLKGQLQEARWFMKSLQSRHETLLKVASCIVERQRGFLEHGEEAMKALVLHDVAETVGMHESTISRVTTKNTCGPRAASSNSNISFPATSAPPPAASVPRRRSAP